MSLIIKKGRVVDPAQKLNEETDLLIEGGKVVKIGKNLSVPGAETVDAKGLLVFPGLVDMHVHLREPGFEYKETIASGGRAAAAGGFTSIAAMPNTLPMNDNEGITSFIVDKAAAESPVRVFPISAVSREQEGKELVEMGSIVEAGAVAFSEDGFPIRSPLILRRALEFQKTLGKIIIEHAEDLVLSGEGVAHASAFTYKLGLKGIPYSSETAAIARDIEILREFGGKIHFAHLSSRFSVELVERAKRDGLQVTAEVTPHHLLLNEDLLSTYSPLYKTKPPLREEKDRLSLVDALAKGIIDVIATDHAPHSQDEKELEFDFAPFGVIGLETAAGLIYDRLVSTKLISLERFVEVLSLNPAKILGLSGKGTLAVGSDGDVTVFDPEKRVVVDCEQFQSHARNTPFQGWKAQGWPVMTFVAGRRVF